MVTMDKPKDALAADYEKAIGILKSGFQRGRFSRPQVGSIKGTLDRLYRAVNGRPQAEA